MTTIPVSPPREERIAEPIARREAWRRFLLACGILSAGWYAAMTIFVATQWSGYSSSSQVISELSAVDAPTRRLWVLLGIPYTILAVAFGWGVWVSAGRNRALRFVGASLLASAALGLGWPFAPMHLREVVAAGGATLGDTMHIVLGGLTVMLMLVAIGFGAAAFGPRFRIYSIVSVVIVLIFGVLTFLEAPDLGANRPTPWIGTWERINIGISMLWNAVLALRLLRAPERTLRMNA